MGYQYPGGAIVNERITRAEAPDKCDVCGRGTDVAQIIGTVEGPDEATGGVATLQFVCTYCCARAIQAVTGFRAVRTLHSWYEVRARYNKVKPGNVHRVPNPGPMVD